MVNYSFNLGYKKVASELKEINWCVVSVDNWTSLICLFLFSLSMKVVCNRRPFEWGLKVQCDFWAEMQHNTHIYVFYDI